MITGFMMRPPRADVRSPIPAARFFRFVPVRLHPRRLWFLASPHHARHPRRRATPGNGRDQETDNPDAPRPHADAEKRNHRARCRNIPIKQRHARRGKFRTVSTAWFLPVPLASRQSTKV
jgi:hypothetical protein